MTEKMNTLNFRSDKTEPVQDDRALDNNLYVGDGDSTGFKVLSYDDS